LTVFLKKEFMTRCGLTYFTRKSFTSNCGFYSKFYPLNNPGHICGVIINSFLFKNKFTGIDKNDF
jgi:hypothetical protein